MEGNYRPPRQIRARTFVLFFKFFLRRTPHLATHIKINYQTRCAHTQQRESTKDGFFSSFFILQSVCRNVYVVIIVYTLPGRPIPSSRSRRRSLFPLRFSFFSFYFHARHVVFVLGWRHLQTEVRLLSVAHDSHQGQPINILGRPPDIQCAQKEIK